MNSYVNLGQLVSYNINQTYEYQSGLKRRWGSWGTCLLALVPLGEFPPCADTRLTVGLPLFVVLPICFQPLPRFLLALLYP